MDRQNRRDTGALRSTGLMRRRPIHPPYRPHPCCSCGCDMYQPDWLTGQDRTMAIVTGGIDAGAGEAIAFTDGCESGDTIRLHGPGTYYAAYTLHMPAAGAFCLQLDGNVLPESCAEVLPGGHAFAQAMFTVAQPADLQLIAAEALSVAADCDLPLITLAVFRIG